MRPSKWTNNLINLQHLRCTVHFLWQTNAIHLLKFNTLHVASLSFELSSKLITAFIQPAKRSFSLSEVLRKWLTRCGQDMCRYHASVAAYVSHTRRVDKNAIYLQLKITPVRCTMLLWGDKQTLFFRNHRRSEVCQILANLSIQLISIIILRESVLARQDNPKNKRW